MRAALPVMAGVLYAVGTYLLLQRTLTRILLGVAVMGHGANLLLLNAGAPGNPPLLDATGGPFADPLPQALVLTAVVINFAVTTFLLTLAYRSWVARRDDEVEDDLEDRRVAEAGGPA